MKLPIYSHIKAKLESKGLDSSASGQIAWFVCSVGIVYGVAVFLYLHMAMEGDIPLGLVFVAIYINHLLFFIYMWLILLLNLLYKENTLSLLLAIMTTFVYFDNEYFAYALALIICVILYVIKQRFFFTYLIALVYIAATYGVFELRGGFYK